MPSNEVKRLAKEEAISAKTVCRAKEELNLRAAKDNRGWVWILPADDDEG